LESPLYTTAIECVPAVSDWSIKLADPSTSVAVSTTVPLSSKLTVPVGVLPPDPLTVAINVTGWPRIVGFSELVTLVCDVAASAAVQESSPANTPTPRFAFRILSMVFSSAADGAHPLRRNPGGKTGTGRKKISAVRNRTLPATVSNGSRIPGP
jgi:hypothetical protein